MLPDLLEPPPFPCFAFPCLTLTFSHKAPMLPVDIIDIFCPGLHSLLTVFFPCPLSLLVAVATLAVASE